MGYWLYPDGTSHWGVKLAWHGQTGVAKSISALVHTHVESRVKRRMYRWRNFWPY